MFELFLTQWLNQKLRGTPPRLHDAITYSVLGGGKFIRPRLVQATALMLGMNERDALYPAGALELFHAFTLIHDDMPCLDNDDFRRGRPSCHRAFGQATALLAGDALHGLAMECFLDLAPRSSPGNWVRAYQRFLRLTGAHGVIGGQVAEMDLNPHSSHLELESVFRRKTGALFELAVLLPADLIGMQQHSEDFEILSETSRVLGLGFQIADDLDDAVDSQTASPSHILHYLSRKDAVNHALLALNPSLKRVENRWGSSAKSYLEIAESVVDQLKGKLK